MSNLNQSQDISLSKAPAESLGLYPRERTLKILVTVKKVVNVDLNIRVKAGAIIEDGLQYVLNAWDENAVEAAVTLQEQLEAETTLVCIGDEDATPVIRKAFAMGIKNGIHVNDAGLINADSYTHACILQKIVKNRAFDLIIMGKQAQDTDNGHAGLMMAELTGLPCVCNVIGIEFLDEEHLKISRLGDTGREIIELRLPAVITLNDSANEPRLPILKGIMRAKKKKIETLDIASLGLSLDEVEARTEILEFLPPAQRQSGKLFEGDAKEITNQVVNLLSTEAKVL